MNVTLIIYFYIHISDKCFYGFCSKDKTKIQEFVTERAYPVSTALIITLVTFMLVYRDFDA